MKKFSNQIFLFCFCGLIAFLSSCSQESDLVGTSSVDDKLSTRSSMCDFPSFHVCDSKDLHLYNINGLYHDDIVQDEPEIVSSQCIQLDPGEECVTRSFIQERFDLIVLELTDPGKFGPTCLWYAQAIDFHCQINNGAFELCFTVVIDTECITNNDVPGPTDSPGGN